MIGENSRQNNASSAEEREIAIIGMACLFPGAPDLAAYWQNILHKVDAVTDPPPEAWDPAVFYDPDATGNDRVYCKRGGFLGSIATFDPIKHNVMPVAVTGTEPDQWLALQAARAAFTDAGYGDEIPERRRTAVILGKGNYPNRGNATGTQHGHVVDQTLDLLRTLHPELSQEDIESIRRGLKKSLPPFNSDTAPGLIPNIVASRIANHLDLMGPSYTVDAACASFMVAAEAAMRGLRRGEIDLALVGGVHAWTPVPMTMLFTHLGALSRRQQIRPFDADADGTVLGEGVGMVVLKRLADAERDGNRIYAVIKGVGIASDGRGLGVLAPRLEGEILALEHAYADAGVAPQSIGLIEAHGTGTPTGDATEIDSLNHILGPRAGDFPTCALGSVKSMLGHMMPAAGAAGLIKVALSLYHKVLPPTLNVEHPHPKLENPTSRLYLNTEARPWIHGGADAPRRAGVNAFGFGGINAHLIVEEYTPAQAQSVAAPPAWDSEVFIIRAGARADLIPAIDRVAAYLDATPEPNLTDLAYTLATQPVGGGQETCVAIVATDVADLQSKLGRARQRLADPKCTRIKDVQGIYYAAEPMATEGKVAVLFPGEGSQYPNMLADLCVHFPEVRAQFDQVDRVYTGQASVPSDVIFPQPSFGTEARNAAEERLWQMDHAVEAVVTTNRAMYALLQRLGLAPDALIGHSSGEYSAILASGMIQLPDEATLARFAADLSRVGGMMAEGAGMAPATLLAVGADAETLTELIAQVEGRVYIAMDNCPHQTVLAGAPEALDGVQELLAARGIIYEKLAFDRAYHTPLFRAAVDHLEPFFARWLTAAPSIPTYSCTTAAPFPDDPAQIRKIAIDHWLLPVEFRRTVEAMHGAGVRIFVEAGPRGNLTAFVDDILRGKPHIAIPADMPHRSGTLQLNHLVGLLTAHGVQLDLGYLYARRSPQQIDLEHVGETKKGEDAGRRMKLLTGWPAMSLSEETAASIRKHWVEQSPAVAAAYENGNGTNGVNGGAGQAPHAPAQPAAMPEPSAPSVQAAPMRNGGHAAAPPTSLPVQTPPAPIIASGAPATGAGRVMAAHLQAMDQFLAAQQDVMMAYLARQQKMPTVAPAVSGMGYAAPSVVEIDAPAVQVAPTAQGTSLAQPIPSVEAAPVAPAAPTVQEREPVREATAAPVGAPAPVLDSQELRELMLRIVSERTGYPVEMLDLDIDLEANLGIDSIKRVEVVGLLQRETGQRFTDETMEALSGQKTLRRILEVLAANRSETGSAGPSPKPPDIPTPASQAELPVGGPLLGMIVTFVPGRELVAQRTLTLTHDLFLHDHTLSRAVAITDPALHGLAVMPFTMSLEMMAEAAAALSPGKQVVGMRDVRAQRWMIVEEQGLPLTITARRQHDMVEVVIAAAGPGGNGAGAYVEGTVIVADRLPPPPNLGAAPLHGARPSQWSPAQLYQTGMFHGPSFQGVASMDVWGEDGAEATLRTQARDGLFAGEPNPALITDPVLLDQPGQVLAFWLAESAGRQRMILPYRLAALHIYSAPATVSLTCQVRVLARDDNRIAANLDVVDGGGRICVRFEGWEDRQFDLPEPVLRYLVAPGEVMLSQLWREPLEGWAAGTDLQLYALDGGLFPAGFFEGYGGIWMQVLAQAILSRREREVWKRMDATTKRRKDWLLGRIVAKDAVRHRLAGRGLALAPADIEIMADANGKPGVEGVWSEGAGGAPALSISHTEGMAVALVGNTPTSLGVDVEPLERLGEWQYDAVFTPEEQAHLAALGNQSAGDWPLRIWCAKEAVAKARGQESVSNPTTLVVVDCNAATGEVRVRQRDRQHDPAQGVHAADEIMAHTCRSHGFIVAAATKTTNLDRES